MREEVVSLQPELRQLVLSISWQNLVSKAARQDYLPKHCLQQHLLFKNVISL